jgi:cholesterol transport system auxiliary component
MKRIYFIFVLLLLLFLEGGCVRLEREYPSRNTFVIGAARAAALPPDIAGAVLEVRSLNVSPLFRGRSFVYRRGDVAYETDFYNQFFTTPGQLLTEDVRRWLADSGIFSRVTTSVPRIEPDFVLEGTIHSLYGDFRRRDQPAAVLEMNFALIDDTPPSERLLHQKTYRRRIPLPAPAATNLAQGWREALQRILGELEVDLKTVSDKW